MLIAADDNGVTRFWDSANGKEIRRFTAGVMPSLARRMARHWPFDGTDRRSVGCRNRQATPRTSRLGRLAGRRSCSLLFAPDGRTIAALAGEKSATLWRCGHGAGTAHLPAQEKSIVCLGFTADSKTLLTALGDRTEDIFLHSGIRAAARSGRHGSHSCGETGTLASAVRVLSRRQDHRPRRSRHRAAQQGNVTNVFTEYRLHLADVATGKEQRRLDATDSVIWSAAFSLDNRAVACQAWTAALAFGTRRQAKRVSRNAPRPAIRVRMAGSPWPSLPTARSWPPPAMVAFFAYGTRPRAGNCSPMPKRITIRLPAWRCAGRQDGGHRRSRPRHSPLGYDNRPATTRFGRAHRLYSPTRFLTRWQDARLRGGR